jgi:hypothetical protein
MPSLCLLNSFQILEIVVKKFLISDERTQSLYLLTSFLAVKIDHSNGTTAGRDNFSSLRSLRTKTNAFTYFRFSFSIRASLNLTFWSFFRLHELLDKKLQIIV